MAGGAFRLNIRDQWILLEDANQLSDERAGSLVAVAADYAMGQTKWEGGGEELAGETSTTFFVFIVPCLSMCCSGG